ncbi:MAG: hypothetical protein GX640_14860, partial [Fibrobacter sp.]|nr:hypothetical protein [Fibrobacter sp.]
RQPQGSNFKIITSINLRSDVELFTKSTSLGSGKTQWDMFEQIMTNSYSCQRSSDTVYNKAGIEYYLEGPGVEGVTQLFAGVSYGGISISPDLSTIVIDTAIMTLSSGSYRIRYNLISDKSKGDTIFFTLSGLPFKPDNRVLSASALADSGDGKVNRFEIYYKNELEELPDSLDLSWPSSAVTKRFYRSSIIPDANNKKHITVSVVDDNQFDSYLTVVKEPLPQGTSFYYDTLYKKQRTVTFPIHDSIGPLITSATLVERETDGMDTIMITLTEDVDVTLFLGKSCLLTKSDGTVVELYVVSSEKTDGVIQLIVKNEGALSPQEHDSLSLNSSSLLRDMSGNRVNPKNKPVTLKLLRKPGKITEAFYKDLNADGRVDYIRVEFDKQIDVNSVKVTVNWLGEDAVEIAASQLTVIDNDRKLVSFSLPSSISTPGKTSGEMDVRFIFTDMNGFIRSSPVTDSAAPVLVSANLFPGVGTTLSEKKPDTLKVVFSEAVSSVGNNSPFIFIQHSKKSTVPITYQMHLTPIDNQARNWSFIVDSIDGTITYPLMTDSVFIDTSAGVADNFKNIQKNPQNSRVALTVKPVPYDIQVLLGPNPFKPGDGQVLSITIVPSTEIKSQVMLEVSAAIFDHLGNMVFYEKKVSDENSSTTKIPFSWNGRNKRGRLAGAGTYLLKIMITDLNTNSFKGIITRGIGIKSNSKN